MLFCFEWSGIFYLPLVEPLLMNRIRNDKFSQVDTTRRLGSALRGAFAGPPTRLKDIPKKSGESRALSKNGGNPAKRDRKAGKRSGGR
jgi:hypothetical protein